jgi:hypothetical protein
MKIVGRWLKLSGSIFLLLGILVLLNACSPSVKVEGDVAKVEKSFTPTKADLAAWEVAEIVYETAKAFSNAKSVEVSLKLAGGFYTDKYGKKPSEDLVMGVVVVRDLDEVRRYVDKSNYANSNKSLYEAKMKEMNYSYLLK